MIQGYASTLSVAVLLAIAIIGQSATAKAENFGRYEGRLVTSWEKNGRDMRLERKFAYIDPMGTLWEVPKGAKVNGASIPKFLWSLIGGPFSGRYREASVIHDYFCFTQTRDWKKVHEIFYFASRASGVGLALANVMYQGVYRFGPSWPKNRTIRSDCKVLTEENFQDCLENAVRSGPTDAREPTAEELKGFLNDLRKKGFNKQVETIEQSMK